MIGILTTSVAVTRKKLPFFLELLPRYQFTSTSIRPTCTVVLCGGHTWQRLPKYSWTSLQNTPASCRYKSTWFSREITRQRDGVSADSELVFVNSMQRYYFWSYILIGMCTAGMTASSLNIMYAYMHGEKILQNVDFPLMYLVLGNVFTFALMFACHWLNAHTLQRIYYTAATDRYTGLKYNMLFKLHHVTFAVADVQHRAIADNDASKIAGNMTISGRAYLLPPDDFVSPRHYNIMLGYMKPDQ